MYTGLLEGEEPLMPFQARIFNNDNFVVEEFLKLKDRFDIQNICEMGTCVGGSSKWMGENFPKVYTVEINPEFRNIALRRFAGIETIESILGNSVECLGDILKKCDDRTIIFLDSHWNDYFPLFDELKIIKASGLKPVIIVHDCKVPNEPNLGFDKYKDEEISYESMEGYLDEIYGVDGYDYHFNSDAKSTLVKRGLIYIYPKKRVIKFPTVK